MTVLDAYAVIAYLRDEPAGAEVHRLLNDATVLTAVNAGEVADQLVRVYGFDVDAVAADLALLAYLGMQILPITAELGLRAGQLRAEHYHRRNRPVSLADCTAAAAALTLVRPLATSDAPLAAMLRAEGGTVHRLPDSTGKRP